MIPKIARLLAGLAVAAGVSGAGVALTTNPSAVPQPAAAAVVAAPGHPSKPAPPKTSQKPSQPRKGNPIPTATEFAAAALAEAKKGVHTRPNVYTKWYASQPFAKEYAAYYGGYSAKAYERAAWCAIFVSYVANKVHLPTGADDALASGMALEYRDEHRLRVSPAIGRLAFFDWSGLEKMNRISHVGIVVGYTPNSVKVVEANVGGYPGKVKVTWRDRDDVVGYGEPFFRK